jgi:hypothetical protein
MNYAEYLFYINAVTSNTGSDVYFYVPTVNSFTVGYDAAGDEIYTFSAFVNGVAKSIDILLFLS